MLIFVGAAALWTDAGLERIANLCLGEGRFTAFPAHFRLASYTAQKRGPGQLPGALPSGPRGAFSAHCFCRSWSERGWG